MSAHTEIKVQAPQRAPDPREPEDNAPPAPLQGTHVDGFKEVEQEPAPQTESKGSGKPPTGPPVVVAPAADGGEFASPLDGRSVFDLPYGGA